MTLHKPAPRAAPQQTGQQAGQQTGQTGRRKTPDQGRARRTRKPAPPPPAWRVALAEFWAGLATPSRAGAGAMLAGFAVACLYTLWFFSPAALAGRGGDFLPRSDQDAPAFATVEALRLGARPAARPRVLILGSSTIAQALGTGAAFERAFEAGTGQDWDVHMLATPLQNPLDQFALLETALAGQGPDSPPVLVLIGSGLTRPGWTAALMLDPRVRHRLGLTSAWEVEEARRLGADDPDPTGIYILDNRDFVLLNGTEALLRSLLRLAPERRPDSYARGRAQPPGTRTNPGIRQRILEGRQGMTAYFAQQSRLATRLEALPGVHLAHVELPLAPDFIRRAGLTRIEREQRQLMADGLEALGAGYLTPEGQDWALAPEDFHDALHVRRGAPQARLSDGIARLAAAFWQKRKAGP